MITEIILYTACKVRCSLLVIFLSSYLLFVIDCIIIQSSNLAEEHAIVLERGEFFIFVVPLPASSSHFTPSPVARPSSLHNLFFCIT